MQLSSSEDENDSLATTTAAHAETASQLRGPHAADSGQSSKAAQTLGWLLAIIPPTCWGWSLRAEPLVWGMDYANGAGASLALTLATSLSSIGANVVLNNNGDLVSLFDELAGRIKTAFSYNTDPATSGKHDPIDWFNFASTLVSTGVVAFGFTALNAGSLGGLYCLEPFSNTTDNTVYNAIGSGIQSAGEYLLAPTNKTTHTLIYTFPTMGNGAYYAATYAGSLALTFSRVIGYSNAQPVQAARVGFCASTTKLKKRVISVHTDATLKCLYKGRINDATEYAISTYLSMDSIEISQIIASMNAFPEHQPNDTYTRHMVKLARLATIYLNNPAAALGVKPNQRAAFWLRYNARETIPFIGRNLSVLGFLPAIELIIKELAFISPELGAVVSVLMMSLIRFFSSGPDKTLRDIMSCRCCYNTKGDEDYNAYLRQKGMIVGLAGLLFFVVGILTAAATVSNTMQVVAGLRSALQIFIILVAAIGTVEFNLSGLLPKGVQLILKLCSKEGNQSYSRLEAELGKYLLASYVSPTELMGTNPNSLRTTKSEDTAIENVLSKLRFGNQELTAQKIGQRAFYEEIALLAVTLVAIALGLTGVMVMDGVGMPSNSTPSNNSESCTNQTISCYGFNATTCSNSSSVSDLPLDLFHTHFSPWVFGLLFVFMLCRETLSYRKNLVTAFATAFIKLLVAAPTITAYTYGASLLSAGQLGSLSTDEWPDKLSTAATALILFGVANDVSESMFGQLVQLSCNQRRQTSRGTRVTTTTTALLDQKRADEDVQTSMELPASSYGTDR